MVAVTADIFSGRPNPTWIIDEKESARILKKVASKPEIISRVDRNQDGYDNLGYRGLYIGLLSDELTFKYNLPHHFKILNGAARQNSKDIEIGLEIIASLEKSSFYDENRKLSANQPKGMVNLIKSEMVKTIQAKPGKVIYEQEVKDVAENAATAKTGGVPKAAGCTINLCAFNPSFWNNCKTVKQNNNCYNYATNRRTDSFAQPGRGSGHPNGTMQCANVSQAARYDGAHNRYDCFPASEAPRYLMAMVVWPGHDYHWYRKHCEGFWGHKPGNTDAKNTDNSGNVIYSPETCNRGSYTNFCGYFYSCKSMKVL